MAGLRRCRRVSLDTAPPWVAGWTGRLDRRTVKAEYMEEPVG